MTISASSSPPTRRDLPLLSTTGVHGNRSPVTCRLRCGDACFHPEPNLSKNEYFRDIASSALSRRAVLGAGAAATALGAIGHVLPAAAAPRDSGRLQFTPIRPREMTVDSLDVPSGYSYHPIIRWGDAVEQGAPEFDPANPSPEAQAKQFGYNCDYLDVLETNGRGTRGVLIVNHEYTNESIMFPPGTDPETVIRCAWAAHGGSVVAVKRDKRGGIWEVDRGSRMNRRITLDTTFRFDGPVTGSDLLKTVEDPRGRRVRGMLNNCSGGTTPWGTWLSGEENFHFYFKSDGATAEEQRYGLRAGIDTRNWSSVDPRWDATRPEYANEPNRFGWICEIDPSAPNSTPVKHTAMGRLKHEGANVIVNRDGHVVAYMGDDERFEYIYRFVSRDKLRKGNSLAAREHNKRLLSAGDLSVARFTGDGLGDGVSDGSGEWLPLTRDGRSMIPGMSVEEVLTFTRLAADAAGATKMDRPEDVQPSLHSGYIYAACTNNSLRTAAEVDEANPRANNRNGHVVEIRPAGGNQTARGFSWNLILICGNPGDAGTYFGGYDGPVSPIACPDNVAFDSSGNLWVSTDGMYDDLELNDGLFKVPVEGPERGRVQQFLSTPAGAETCGPVIRDREGYVLVSVQHPGEDGSWEVPQSRFPDYTDGVPPRPTVVQVTRRR